MAHLYIFRHGETDWNFQGRFQSQVDIPLNDKGREQAVRLQAPMAARNLEAIISSDLDRAVETAQLARGENDIPIFQDEALREADIGPSSGMTFEEMEAKVGADLVARWRSCTPENLDIRFPGGETGRQIITRAVNCLERFVRAHSFETIGVSSHGGVIRRLAQHAHPERRETIRVPNGSAYLFELDERGWRLLNYV